MSREWLFRTLLVLGSLLLAFVVLESACRLLGLGRPNPHATGDRGLFVAHPDPKISYCLKPGFSGSVYGSHVEINSRNLREPESLTYQPPAGVQRILCLGDSVVFGFGVAREDAFPSVLQDLLNQNTQQSIETINTGVPGYNTVQETRFLETEGQRYQPDLVLLFLVANDPESIRRLDQDGHLLPAPEDIWLRLSRKYERLSAPESMFRSVNAFRRGIAPFTSKYRQIVEEVVEYYTEEIFENPGWKDCRDALARLHEWETKHNVPVIAVVLPMLSDFENHPYIPTYERFLGACDEAGLKSWYGWDALARYDPDSLRVHPLDGHPGSLGHRVIAEFLAERTAELLQCH